MQPLELLLRGTGLVLMWLSAIQLKRIVDRMDDANDLFRRIDARVVNELLPSRSGSPLAHTRALPHLHAANE